MMGMESAKSLDGVILTDDFRLEPYIEEPLEDFDFIDTVSTLTGASDCRISDFFSYRSSLKLGVVGQSLS